MKKAPHLPNRACQVDTYYRLQNVKWILLFAGFAFVAGISASLIAATWILPVYEPIQFVQYNTQDNKNLLQSVPDSLLKKQSEQRMMSIFDIRKKSAKNIYSDHSFVGRGAIISSDGWLVFFIPNYSLGQEKFWELVDYQNNNYKVEKFYFDNTNGLLYVKIKADGLRVVNFPDWKKINIGSSVWSVGYGEWQSRFVKNYNDLNGNNLFYVWQSEYGFIFDEIVDEGNLLISNQGDLIGLSAIDNNIIFGWQIEKQINSLLETGKVVYQSLPWQGRFVQAIDENSRGIAGFYITKSPTKISTTTVGIGDIVIKINNEPVDSFNFARQMWLAPDEFNVVVWRDGQEIEILVKKVLVQ